jgi:hypothetical protein
MAQQLLELDTEDGGTILVAVDVPETAVGRVSAPGEPPIKKLDQSFDVVRALISWDTLEKSGGSNPRILRSSYVAAYLSLGAGKNRTTILNNAFSAAHQVSDKAPSYTLDAQVVQKIIDRRNKLQGLPLDSREWNDFRKGIV